MAVKGNGMLDIKGLRAKVANKEILRGIDLHVGTGEVHAIMGPTGQEKAPWRMFWPAEKII